ncbi:putative nADH dehydrogenase i chain a [Rickettsia endosymbiont of Ixodes pacificus]|uniref:Uncharacterized protein n=1 Tax=Rickettsia tamurae subsp. buchneri TaxID=1462938 RepID=A0A8E1C0M0_9RICK|nr:hypothetical protein [Rickettsia endosymbiont of Ixodes pacificus]EER21789.1 NADH dehydrogenase i chain a [Rickettsia endosymbiont of Ixodes scapularis]KDO03651.1 hypothetical protein REISMN_00540 [Rickettsia tamurae subsp. buchneri]KJW02615.1 putative nADH dehydrogenase i chain a [Rickettsia endosymbiont of Ixodes pacificus]
MLFEVNIEISIIKPTSLRGPVKPTVSPRGLTTGSRKKFKKSGSRDQVAG